MVLPAQRHTIGGAIGDTVQGGADEQTQADDSSKSGESCRSTVGQPPCSGGMSCVLFTVQTQAAGEINEPSPTGLEEPSSAAKERLGVGVLVATREEGDTPRVADCVGVTYTIADVDGDTVAIGDNDWDPVIDRALGDCEDDADDDDVKKSEADWVKDDVVE